MSIEDTSDKQKSIDDLYNLLSVTIDLQKQILTSLKKLESKGDAPVEKTDPGSLSSLQKEMLRWILNSDSMKSATGIDPSDLRKETPFEADRASPSTFENVNAASIANEYTQRTNVDQSPVTNTAEATETEATAANDSDNDDIFNFIDNDFRDIIKIPENSKDTISSGKSPSAYVRLQGLVAILLTEIQERHIDIHDKLVADEYNKLKELSKKVHASMIKYIDKKNITADDAATLRWSEIPIKTKNKFMLIMEKKARRKLGLDIGRCQDMWGASVLLCKLVGARRTTVRKSNNRLRSQITFDKLCSVDKNASPATDGSNNASDAEINNQSVTKLDATIPIGQDNLSNIDVNANIPIRGQDIDGNELKLDYGTLPINRVGEKLDSTSPINVFDVSSPRPLNESNGNDIPLQEWVAGEKRSELDNESRTDEEHIREKRLKRVVA